jgi:hypothetical protein
MVASFPSNATERTASTWARTYLVDITTLVLGTVLALRFWYLFFGVGDYRLMTVLTCHRRVRGREACDSGVPPLERPQLFCGDRRADLMAALALGTAPWPITIPVTAATPLWAIGTTAGAGRLGGSARRRARRRRRSPSPALHVEHLENAKAAKTQTTV